MILPIHRNHPIERLAFSFARVTTEEQANMSLISVIMRRW